MQMQKSFSLSRVLIAGWALAAVMAIPALVSAQEAVHQPDQVSEQPKIADANQARTAISRSYTSALQDAGLEGRVEVAFIVNADGSVDPGSIKVLKTPVEALGKAAEVAVARIKFQPAKKDGSTVRCQAALAVVYKKGV